MAPPSRSRVSHFLAFEKRGNEIAHDLTLIEKTNADLQALHERSCQTMHISFDGPGIGDRKEHQMITPNRRFVALSLAILVFGGAALTNASPPATARAIVDWPTGSADAYQGPDGAYGSAAEPSRDVQGAPCNLTCSNEEQEPFDLIQLQ